MCKLSVTEWSCSDATIAFRRIMYERPHLTYFKTYSMLQVTPVARAGAVLLMGLLCNYLILVPSRNLGLMQVIL